jgi:hypothetical protein
LGASEASGAVASHENELGDLNGARARRAVPLQENYNVNFRLMGFPKIGFLRDFAAPREKDFSFIPCISWLKKGFAFSILYSQFALSITIHTRNPS